jgi:hypothetical protein
MRGFIEVANCRACGASTTSIYRIQFYFLPSRVVRKRHRDRERQAFFCRECFEKTPELPVEVGGRRFHVPKSPRVLEKTRSCLRCGEEAVKEGRLYGLLACTLLVRGSAIESLPLASLCAACGEGNALEIR